MSVSVMIAVSVVVLGLTGRWAALSVSGRPRFQACGYRLVRQNRHPAVVISNGFGIGVLGGISLVIFLMDLAVRSLIDAILAIFGA